MKIKKIKPLYTKILVTMEKYGADELTGSLITKTTGTVKEIQKVIAVGTTVRDIKEGNLVKVNPDKYAIYKYKDNSIKGDIMTNEIIGYKIPQIEVDGHTYMLLEDRDIEYIIEEFEEDKPDAGIIHTEPKIILN